MVMVMVMGFARSSGMIVYSSRIDLKAFKIGGRCYDWCLRCLYQRITCLSVLGFSEHIESTYRQFRQALMSRNKNNTFHPSLLWTAVVIKYLPVIDSYLVVTS